MLRYSASIGTATNYSAPGVGAGRLYVGTRDGKVLGFGSPVTQPLSGSALTLPRTTIGASSSPQTLTLTANRNVTISSFGSASSQFTLGSPSRALPADLTAGQTISVPVTFSPTQTGGVGGQVNVTTTNAGTVSFALSGVGQSAPVQLAVSPPIVSLGGTATGGHLTGTVSFSNVGSTALTISAIHLPNAPFSATNVPNVNDTIAPGTAITVDISFDPTQVGAFTSAIGLDSDGGNKSIGLSASAGTPGLLRVSSETNDYGPVPVGTTATKTFTITNAGGTNVTITKSKPPFGGYFMATTSLGEGTTIAPAETLIETVTFAPRSVGTSTGTWLINGDDSSGLHQVQFTGSGITASAPPPTPPPGAVGPPVITHQPIAPKIVPRVATTVAIRSIYITYTAAVAGTAHFTLQREIVGRRGAHGCVPETARNRRAHRCTVFVNITTFTHLDQVGANRVRIASYAPARKLVPGTYRLRSILIDTAAGKHTMYSVFRITSAPRRGSFRP